MHKQPMRLLNLFQANAKRGSFRAEANTIYLYDVIVGNQLEADFFGGVTATGFIEALSGMTGPVKVRINSPGGDVFAGWAISQAIRDYQSSKGEITAYVDGVAASAASVVATAAKRTKMAKSSMMMIHKAWSMAVGNSNDMLETAALLDKVDGILAQSYAERAGGDASAFLDMMNQETWFTPEEAIALRLADGLADDREAAAMSASWDLSAYAKAPAASAPIVVPFVQDNSEEIEQRKRAHAVRMLMKTA